MIFHILSHSHLYNLFQDPAMWHGVREAGCRMDRRSVIEHCRSGHFAFLLHRLKQLFLLFWHACMSGRFMPHGRII